MKCHRRECRKAAKFIGSCEEIDGRTTEKFMGAGFFGVDTIQHASSFDDALERDSQFGPRCRLMCLVYVRCLFCEASRTSSVGCFVCDLLRFSMKLKWECETLEKLGTRTSSTLREWVMNPSLRRLRYRTNLFVIMGLVQRTDDVIAVS